MNAGNSHDLKYYYTFTFGCQMNERDSETMAGLVENMGFLPVEEAEKADLILINTCCVRETAENKVYGLLGRLAALKKKRPQVLIAMGGCMAQQPHVQKKIKERFPQVDILFGTFNLHELPHLIDTALATGSRVFAVPGEAGEIIEGVPFRRKHALKAWVNITFGCNNYCTYCIVPYVRGRERSRQPEHILEEIRALAAEGVKEVTLLGQNVNSYGRDLNRPDANFALLLRAVNEIEGIERIRFTTSHPRDFSDDIIAAMAESEKVCEHVHLPVQAGSNNVLRAMNRGYTREYYLELVEKIRTWVKDVAITTDIMVGFPGETEEDFADTMDLVEKVRFDSAFMFIYNPREGTPAARRPDQVEEQEKSRRIQILIQRQNEITCEINRAEVGRVYEVLVEGYSKENPELLSGRTRTNKLVFFAGPADLIGQIIPVQVTGGYLTHLTGQPVTA